MKAPHRSCIPLAAAALLMTAACGHPNDGPDLSEQALGAIGLYVSTSSDRSMAVKLGSSVQQGRVYIFSTPSTGVAQVAFYLDDPKRQRSPMSVDSSPPFDLAGTAADGLALPFDLATLTPGTHSLRAQVKGTDGKSRSTTVTFMVAEATQTPDPTPEPEPEPTPDPEPQPLPTFGDFPTPETTGPRVPLSSLTPSSGITSTHDGQIIEFKDVTGNIRIKHDNVIVRDSRISFTSTYGLNVIKKADGSCPVGARFEYVEVDGRLAAESDIPIYSPGCPWVLDHAYVHNVGRSSRVVNDNVVSNSYILANRSGDSGSHRGAVGNNGGRNNQLINNVLICASERGCSAAIPMYGDFAPVDGMLVQRNLLATTGGYCAYGGSLSSKPYPHGSNIKFIDNHFSTRFNPNCGKYGHLAGFAGGVRGNEWRGNVWHETGQLIGSSGPINP